MKDDTKPAPRAVPPPMKLYIGKWEDCGDCGEGAVKKFTVLATLPGSATDKEVKAAVKKLGEGDYTGLLGRERPLSYRTTTKEVFAV